MSTGRRRATAASCTASAMPSPFWRRWLANSTIRMPFFVTSPMSITIPIWLKMLIVWSKYQSETSAPASASGTVSMIVNGSRKLSNCAASTR